MKELVEVIAKSLVDFPDEVVVTESENEKGTLLELRVAQSDMGKVIGKQGRIAKAIRAVVKAALSTPQLRGACFSMKQIHERICTIGDFMEDLFQVGVITAPHGVRGEVKVFPTTDDNARFKNLKTVLLDQGRGTRELEIEGVKFFKNMVILKFKGIDDRNDVERMRQAKLLVTRENAVELGKDEYFIADLIGIQVVSDEGEELGTISDVLQTGANDVYVVSKDGAKDLLIPAIHACIQNVDVAAGQMEVHLLPGLR